MNVKELMINDLILYRARVQQVKGLRDTDNTVQLIPHHQDEGLHTCNANEITRISLAEYYLMLNGWQPCVWERTVYKLVDDTKTIEIDLVHHWFSCSGYVRCKIPGVLYIHQLQQMMRICGLHRLADTFNIPDCNI